MPSSARILARIVTALVIAAAILLSSPPSARADIGRFDLAGKIYNKWLYQNDDSQGLVTYGNPFWPDNITGNNGVGSEFELKIMGAVSNAVRAEVRLKSRFGALWQDWWENGDRSYDEHNTSGESLGMNHAEYIKLRGYYIDANLPIPTVRSVLVGSSDLGMFNPWTIGKVRYIDRDNAKGTFITGGTDSGYFGYVLAAIALPKLFAGPGWSTGIGDQALRNPFYSQDWAFATKLHGGTLDTGTFTLVSSVTVDHEINLADPDADGSAQPQCLDALDNPIAGCVKDHSVEQVTRYSNSVTTLEYDGAWGSFAVDATAAFSFSDVNEDVTFNGVAGNEGVFPIVFDDVWDFAGVLRLALNDPFEFGLSFKLEGFAIGPNFNSIFGARREADVLLTDGFVEGGQLPTLNIANEFMDFDEAWYETAIGWSGITSLTELELDFLSLSLEGTFIYHLTNMQERDVDQVYPDFLHTDGFTDTDIYDFANAVDRGRDLRSIYHRNQDRISAIAVLAGRVAPEFDELVWGLGFKLKFIGDFDQRSHTIDTDDYAGLRLMGRVATDLLLADALKLELGGGAEYWIEDNRRGTLELGYGDDTTLKVKAHTGLSYTWSGFNFSYRLEYVYKDQQREREPDQLWHVVRSKATLEVLW